MGKFMISGIQQIGVGTVDFRMSWDMTPSSAILCADSVNTTLCPTAINSTEE